MTRPSAAAAQQQPLALVGQQIVWPLSIPIESTSCAGPDAGAPLALGVEFYGPDGQPIPVVASAPRLTERGSTVKTELRFDGTSAGPYDLILEIEPNFGHYQTRFWVVADGRGSPSFEVETLFDRTIDAGQPQPIDPYDPNGDAYGYYGHLPPDAPSFSGCPALQHSSNGALFCAQAGWVVAFREGKEIGRWNNASQLRVAGDAAWVLRGSTVLRLQDYGEGALAEQSLALEFAQFDAASFAMAADSDHLLIWSRDTVTLFSALPDRGASIVGRATAKGPDRSGLAVFDVDAGIVLLADVTGWGRVSLSTGKMLGGWHVDDQRSRSATGPTRLGAAVAHDGLWLASGFVPLDPQRSAMLVDVPEGWAPIGEWGSWSSNFSPPASPFLFQQAPGKGSELTATLIASTTASGVQYSYFVGIHGGRPTQSTREFYVEQSLGETWVYALDGGTPRFPSNGGRRRPDAGSVVTDRGLPGADGGASLDAGLAVDAGIRSVDAGPAPSTFAGFPAQVQYPAGWNPRSMVAADFDGDGNADIAVTNLVGTVSLLRGRGDGTLRPRVASPTAATSQYLAAGDFDGDQRLDVAVCSQPNLVSVLRELDGGMFGPPASQTTGAESWAVDVGDLDNDGHLDLAVASGSNNAIAVFKGFGNGLFQSPSFVPAGAWASEVKMADLNEDGRADLVVTAYKKVVVLFGKGGGSFAAPASLGLGADPWGTTVADLDGDGWLDVATTDRWNDGINIAFNTGTGQFVSAATLSTIDMAAHLTAADLNGDGRVDLVALGANATVAIHLNAGSGQFHWPLSYTTGAAPFAVSVADFNRDGKPDLAVANDQSATISVLLQQ